MANPTAILVNKATGRFHPMPFRPAPRPSDNLERDGACRHKSIGHHTEGFATLNEAIAHIKDNENYWPTGQLFEWDGEGIPATTCDYPITSPEAGRRALEEGK